MASVEQDRLNHFRQRWADENFKDYLEGSYSPRNSSIGDNHQGIIDILTSQELAANRNSGNSSRPKKQKSRQSWHSSFFGKVEQRRSDSDIILPASSPKHDSLVEQTAIPATSSKVAETGGPPKWLTEVYTVSWLIFFSLLGTLARLGTEVITVYPNAPVTSRVLWANVGGCFTMGLLMKDQRPSKRPTTPADLEKYNMEEPDKARVDHIQPKPITPLYIGITTGFCSSFTFFSGFMRDAFLAMTNGLAPPSLTQPYHNMTDLSPRNGGYSFLALCAILILHPGLSIISFQGGQQIASQIQSILNLSISNKLLTKLLNPIIVPLSIGSWLGATLTLSIIPPYHATNWRNRALLPLVFAPLGCLARYYLSKAFNNKTTTFPIGTFTANITATLLLGMSFDLQHLHSIGGSNPTTCAILNGVMQGFCGALGSVSTWVAELQMLRSRHAWVYGLTSVVVGFAGLVGIMGGMGWSVGFERPVCG